MNVAISRNHGVVNSVFEVNYKNKNSIKNHKKDKGKSLKLKNSEIEGLQKQKQNLIDSKNQITERGLKKKESSSEIQKQLKDVDKQIESIDKQISAIKLEQQEKAIKKDSNGKDSEKQKDEDESKKDKQRKLDNEILVSFNGLRQAQRVAGQRIKMNGRANILKVEIKQDEEMGVDSKDKKGELDTINNSLKGIDNKVNPKLTKKESIYKNGKNKVSIEKHCINKYKDNNKSEKNYIGEKIDSES